MISANRLKAIIVKEALHIVRDPQTLGIVLLMPVAMMFIYGYALSMDVSEVPVAVEDPVQTVFSRAITRAVDATTMFHVVAVYNVVSDPEALFRSSRIKALFRFSSSFDSDLRSPARSAAVQILIDGSDSNLGTIIKNAADAVLVGPAVRLLNMPDPPTVTIHRYILYNPRQKSAFYFVPGLMAIILMMISALLTSVTLTREKELGTLAQLLVSPLKPAEILIGKLAPYLLLAAADGVFILVIGRLGFGVTVAGSYLLLAATSVVYIFTSLAIGLLVSTIAARQWHAMITALTVTLMPSVLLSGFVFPVSSMPVPLQVVSYVIPATHFLKIVRGIVLKGVGLDVLWQPLLVLLVEGIVLVILAVRKFRTTL